MQKYFPLYILIVSSLLISMAPSQATSPCPDPIESKDEDGNIIVTPPGECPPLIPPIIAGILFTTMAPSSVTEDLLKASERSNQQRERFVSANLTQLQLELSRQTNAIDSEYINAFAALSHSTHAAITQQGRSCLNQPQCNLEKALLALP